jgi:hypothetical protein
MNDPKSAVFSLSTSPCRHRDRNRVVRLGRTGVWMDNLWGRNRRVTRVGIVVNDPCHVLCSEGCRVPSCLIASKNNEGGTCVAYVVIAG